MDEARHPKIEWLEREDPSAPRFGRVEREDDADPGVHAEVRHDGRWTLELGHAGDQIRRSGYADDEAAGMAAAEAALPAAWAAFRVFVALPAPSLVWLPTSDAEGALDGYVVGWLVGRIRSQAGGWLAQVVRTTGVEETPHPDRAGAEAAVAAHAARVLPTR